MSRRPGWSKSYAPYDADFNAAFAYFLGAREWTAQEFCERTRLVPGGPRRIHPSSVSDWRKKRGRPSTLAVTVVCETYGVRRSEFFRVGEEMERKRWEWDKRDQLRRLGEHQDFEAIREAVAGLGSPHAQELLAAIEEVVRQRRAELETGAAGPSPAPPPASHLPE